ncbi:MAG: hypothetical protein ACPGQM_11965 [Alphaproteobacteria bacterium]
MWIYEDSTVHAGLSIDKASFEEVSRLLRETLVEVKPKRWAITPAIEFVHAEGAGHDEIMIQ